MAAKNVTIMDNQSEPVKHFWLYALRLEQGKYYVGITSYKHPNQRIKQHLDGPSGAKWTKMYPPTSYMEIVDLGETTRTLAKEVETQKTADYMKRYGVNNVRGGRMVYSRRYIQIFHLIFRLDNFLEIIGILIMMCCFVGLYFLTR